MEAKCTAGSAHARSAAARLLPTRSFTLIQLHSSIGLGTLKSARETSPALRRIEADTVLEPGEDRREIQRHETANIAQTFLFGSNSRLPGGRDDALSAGDRTALPPGTG